MSAFDLCGQTIGSGLNLGQGLLWIIRCFKINSESEHTMRPNYKMMDGAHVIPEIVRTIETSLMTILTELRKYSFHHKKQLLRDFSPQLSPFNCPSSWSLIAACTTFIRYSHALKLSTEILSSGSDYFLYRMFRMRTRSRTFCILFV
jgi:hypothetical protein